MFAVTSEPTRVSSRFNMSRFSSLKSLSDSLPTLIGAFFVDTEHRVTEGIEDSGDGSTRERLSPSKQSGCTMVPVEPSKLSDLIAWKNLEIATVQNILKANMERATDSMLNKTSRRAYRDRAKVNQKTVCHECGWKINKKYSAC